MLTSLVIQLQATTEAQLPASLGRASQAFMLQLMGEELATALHDGEGLKPYTTSNLVIGRREKGQLKVMAGEVGWLRFTALTAEVSVALLAGVSRLPATVNFLGVDFAVMGMTVDPTEHAWAGQIRYQDLAAPYLLGENRPQRRITLRFISPTTFRRQGAFEPFPLPELVFGSLLDHWQAFAPIALHPDMRRYAELTVRVADYELKSRSLPYKNGGQIIAFTGKATFFAMNRDPYWVTVLNLLSEFAFYCGVGYQTTSGLGQVKANEQ